MNRVKVECDKLKVNAAAMDRKRYLSLKIRNFLFYLTKLYGRTPFDELRLLISILNSVFNRGETHLGFNIPGNSLIKLRTWDGVCFVARPKTVDIQNASLILETYELTKWFMPNAKGVVIDVGANVGGYTIRACKNADLVIAIEPLPDVLKVLKYNIAINCKRSRVILLNMAIGDRKGTTTITVPKIGRNYVDHSLATISYRNSKSKLNNEVVHYKVRTDTLDNVIRSLNIRRINLLKVDIEGAESIAFKGMKKTLRITDKIIIEIQNDNLWLIKELEGMNFKLVERKGINYFFIKE